MYMTLAGSPWSPGFYYLTLIGKSWKTHPEFFLKFLFSGSSHRPFYWKTDPFDFLTETIYAMYNLVSISFPVKRSSSRLSFFIKTEKVLMIFRWTSFPVKQSQEFSRNLSKRVKSLMLMVISGYLPNSTGNFIRYK